MFRCQLMTDGLFQDLAVHASCKQPGSLRSLPVTLTPRRPRCGMRLYAVRANKPGIGSSGDTALPFGYCWECEELFKVDIELEQLRPRRAESPPSNRAADPSRRRAHGDTVNEDPRYRESVCRTKYGTVHQTVLGSVMGDVSLFM